MDLLRKYYKEGYAKLQGDPLVDILIEIFLCINRARICPLLSVKVVGRSYQVLHEKS
jgi:hypothetical protein